MKWSKEHPDWIPTAKDDVTSLYNEYKRRHADELIPTAAPFLERSEFERYNTLGEDYDITNDLERYLREERAPSNNQSTAVVASTP